MIEFDYKKLSPLLPYAGAGLIFLGILKLTVYYYFFDVEINKYLELSEYLTSFLGGSFFQIIITISIFFIDFTSPEKARKKNELFERIYEETSLWKRIGLYILTRFKLAVFFCLNIAVGIIIVHYRGLHISLQQWSFLVAPILFMAFIILVFEYRRHYHMLKNKSLDPTYSSIFGLFIGCILTVGFLTVNEVSYVRDFKYNIHVSFQLDSVTIKSDSLHYYIGHTKNYLFYYHQDSLRTDVFPISRIKQMSFAQR